MNETEHRFLSQISDQETKFQKNKRMLLAALALWVCIFIYLVSTLYKTIESFQNEPEFTVLYLSILYPILLAVGILIAIQSSKLYRDWNGNPERKLLISLYEHLKENKAEPDAAGQRR